MDDDLPLITPLLGGGDAAPDGLLRHYPGDLVSLCRGATVANFVATVDSVIAFDDAGRGASAVSRNSPADHLVMALLRTLCGVLLIGAETFRKGRHPWNSESLLPARVSDLRQLRSGILGSTTPPPLAVVSRSGRIDSDHPMFRQTDTPVTVLTSQQGATRLSGLPRDVDVVVLSDDRSIEGADLIATLRDRFGEGMILCEGGPHLFGSLVAAQMIDELFLSVAPHLAGRSAEIHRTALLQGTVFTPDDTPPLQLRSVHESEGMLFLRYAFQRAQGADARR